MDNHFRLLLTVFSEDIESQDCFLTALKKDGWYGGVPIDNRDPNSDSIGLEVRAWGGFLLPDMRIMTATGVTNVGDAARLPHFGQSTLIKQAAVLIGDDECPGFLQPSANATMAIIIGESVVAPPDRWLKTVVDKYYGNGLRFLARIYDLQGKGSEDGTVHLFYSVSADHLDHKIEGSGHCAELWQSVSVLDSPPSKEEEDTLDEVLSFFSAEGRKRLAAAGRAIQNAEAINPVPYVLNPRLSSLIDRLDLRPFPLDNNGERILSVVQGPSIRRDASAKYPAYHSSAVPDGDVVTDVELIWLFHDQWLRVHELICDGTQKTGRAQEDFDKDLKLSAENVGAIVKELNSRIPPARGYCRSDYANQLGKYLRLLWKKANRTKALRETSAILK
jgi:hypothetical protein